MKDNKILELAHGHGAYYGGVRHMTDPAVIEFALAIRREALGEAVRLCDDVIGKAVRAGLTQHADCATNIALALRALAKENT